MTGFVKKYMSDTITYFYAVVIYDFFAFAMQLPLGIIADKYNKNALFSAYGCGMIAIACFLRKFGIIPCLVAGIGNSMFHLGGGIDVLNISEKKATPSGIYVSTGAMGLFLGTKMGSMGFDKYYVIVAIMIISALLLNELYKRVKEGVKNEPMVELKLSKTEIIAIICLMITVVIRSYVGFILKFDWKADSTLAILSVCTVVLGKMLGGVIGDKIGFKRISVISLVLSAFLFLFSFENPQVGLGAILLFNMTMPITLAALSNILNNNKGMAFGLLTFALFIGTIPIFLGYLDVLFSPGGLYVITMISALILYVGIEEYNKVIQK